MKNTFMLSLVVLCAVAALFFLWPTHRDLMHTMPPQPKIEPKNNQEQELLATVPVQQTTAKPSQQADQMVEPSLQANSDLPSPKEVFDTKKFNALLFSKNFTSKAYEYISENRTNASVEHQLYINQNFSTVIRSIEAFSDLSLELAECDNDVCVVSVAGVEYLSASEKSRLEEEMLFNKQGFSKIAAPGTGGTYGLYEKDGVSFFRIVYITNPKFSGLY